MMDALFQGFHAWIVDRVMSGAAWLDRVAPGWEHAIDPGTLNMARGESCIAGQVGHAGLLSPVFNFADDVDYSTVQAKFGEAWCAAHGFAYDDTVADTFHTATREYGILGDTWVSLVKSRFDLGTLSG